MTLHQFSAMSRRRRNALMLVDFWVPYALKSGVSGTVPRIIVSHSMSYGHLEPSIIKARSHDKTTPLSTGSRMPQLGFGTRQSKPHEVELTVEITTSTACRRLELVFFYENQAEIGAALKHRIPSVIKREDLRVCITTKLCNSESAHQPASVQVEKDLDETLAQLGQSRCRPCRRCCDFGDKAEEGPRNQILVYGQDPLKLL
ncbi:Aldo-ket-red domain-containing protein [Mycena chlorophos]|uniref:Aldo-ket-red domain-containing protein n=1 Tax=Mycena chlorophos TaxID=658473 RepID=A0A8H6VWR6_MYCCL|nr:Aldo-ket-red domain-containing protein [Mycena chlorophos]